MLQIAICDENKADREALKNMLEEVMTKYPARYHIETYDSGEELEEMASIFQLIFLDVAIGTHSGIELGRKLYRKHRSKIIFHTQLKKYQTEAINKSHAFAYLKKPIVRDELDELIQDFLSLQDDIQSAWVEFRDIEYFSEKQKLKKEIVRVPMKDILYFESRQQEKGTTIVTERGIFTCPDTISDLEKRMSSFGFELCNRGILVNMDKISQIKGHNIILYNGSSIPLSQKRVAEFKKKMNEFANDSFLGST